MADRSQAASELDRRLAEIDRTLRSIQLELEGGREDGEPIAQSEPEEVRERAASAEHERAYEAPPPSEAAAPPPEPPPAGPGETPAARGEPPAPPREPLSPRREPPPPPERRRPARGGRRGRSGPLAAVLEAAREYPAGSDPLEQISALSGVHVRLLDSSHELLEAYQTLLGQLRTSQGVTREPEPVELTVAAGPFMSLDAVRDFERALAAIPGVVDVAVRGYERGDRAIVDVQLRDPTT